jgi:NAD(P)-dependent dehydrogenase (short-subunit alcohol dehydrogenase family)
VTGEPALALVVGAGPGLGSALARCFAAAGMQVAVAARRPATLLTLVGQLNRGGGRAVAFACDVTEEASVDALFAKVGGELGTPHLVVYNAGAFVPAALVAISAREFRRCWEVGCFGGFLVGQRAARSMLARAPAADGLGTILFTGATASLRGSAGFANLAVGKFGLRAVAQCMARELGPQGIHVAHVVIDGMIASAPSGAPADDSRLDPQAIALQYLHLHRQPRSAWTFELDLRPWVEKF